MLCNSRHRDSCKREFSQKFGWQERESIVTFILKPWNEAVAVASETVYAAIRDAGARKKS
jgi:hypothetical protein